MRVLLVEDEERLSQALVEIFKKNRINIDAVLDGTSALEYAHNGNYDVLILDVMLPGMDGITLLKTLRAEHNSVPIILLTAKDDVADRVQGLDSGADDYLTKPFATEELLARVRALSRRRGEIKSDSTTFCDLTLSKTNCELQSSSGAAIKLSLKEYQILEMLFDHPHQIITKEQVIEKIWGGDSNAEYNNVEVYISFIRKKIENLGVRVRIRTARGIGYSLEDSNR
ncbi:MAG: response regulator transcription factor [Treponema sp.]|nr:response regulator transcription factor [Treponema sp.]